MLLLLLADVAPSFGDLRILGLILLFLLFIAVAVVAAVVVAIILIVRALSKKKDQAPPNAPYGP